jgi:hypothetical protein
VSASSQKSEVSSHILKQQQCSNQGSSFQVEGEIDPVPSVSDLQLDWRNQVENKRSKMNYQRRRSDDTDSTNKRMATSKHNRLRELARLRSLSIQPLSPSSKSEKHHRESSFTFTDNEVECRSPAPETDDVSLSRSSRSEMAKSYHAS